MIQVASTDPDVWSPDMEVPCLTSGLPTPDSVQAQKEAHAKELELELRKGVDQLSKEHKKLTDNLHANANHQRNQYSIALSRMVKEQEILLRDQHEAQLRELRFMAQRQMAELERQAELLVNAWQDQDGGTLYSHAQPLQPRASQVPLPGPRVRASDLVSHTVQAAPMATPAMTPQAGSMRLAMPARKSGPLSLSQRGSIARVAAPGSYSPPYSVQVARSSSSVQVIQAQPMVRPCSMRSPIAMAPAAAVRAVPAQSAAPPGVHVRL
eukprot:s137_g14.t1